MINDQKLSAMVCGCDEGATHLCSACADIGRGYGCSLSLHREQPQQELVDVRGVPVLVPGASAPQPGLFPDSAQGRKDHPVFTGVVMYFPDAIAAVARVSKKGNDQHNPGCPLHWAREKSTDQMDTATRHMMDHGVGVPLDTDGEYHLAKAAWRILAELQLTIEKDKREGR